MQRILGRDRDERMFEHALALSQAAAACPESGFAWFNVGTNLVALGRTGEAVEASTGPCASGGCCGTSSGPSRPTWPKGRLADVQALADANLVQSSDLEESHYFRGGRCRRRGRSRGRGPPTRRRYERTAGSRRPAKRSRI